MQVNGHMFSQNLLSPRVSVREGGLGCAGNENIEGFENQWLPEELTSFRQSPKQFRLLHSQA